MKEKLKAFFEANPEASECHTALGYTHDTLRAAQKTLGGVTGEVVKTYTKEQFEAMFEPKEASQGETEVLELSKRYSKEIKALIEEQQSVTKEKFAAIEGAKTKKEKEAAVKAHNAEVLKLDAMFMALEIRQIEEGKINDVVDNRILEAIEGAILQP